MSQPKKHDELVPLSVSAAELMASLSVRQFSAAQLADMVDRDVYAETVAATGYDPLQPEGEGGGFDTD